MTDLQKLHRAFSVAHEAGDRDRAERLCGLMIVRLQCLSLLKRVDRRVKAGTLDAVAVTDALRPMLNRTRAATSGRQVDFTAAFAECFGRCKAAVRVEVPTTYRGFFDLVTLHRVSTETAAMALGLKRNVAASYRSMAKARARAALAAAS